MRGEVISDNFLMLSFQNDRRKFSGYGPFLGLEGGGEGPKTDFPKIFSWQSYFPDILIPDIIIPSPNLKFELGMKCCSCKL